MMPKSQSQKILRFSHLDAKKRIIVSLILKEDRCNQLFSGDLFNYINLEKTTQAFDMKGSKSDEFLP